MNLIDALASLLGLAFWQFVALNAGPRHHAYLHATWRAYTHRLALRAFLKGQQ